MGEAKLRTWMRLSAVLLGIAGQAFWTQASANVTAPASCTSTTNCVIASASGINNEGHAVSATAQFWLVGSSLHVELINTAMSDVLVPSDVLTGLSFTLMNGTQSLELTPVAANLGKSTDTTLNSGNSTLVYGATTTNGNVGGEWAYESGIDFHGATSGISSSGLDLFGQANFNGPNLAGGTAVDGVQCGLLSKGDNTSTGNGGLSADGCPIKNAVQFKLTVPSGLSASNFNLTARGAFGDIGSQYGTSFGQTYPCAGGANNCDQVPLPGTAIIGNKL